MGGVCVQVQVTGRGCFYSLAQSCRLDFELQQHGELEVCSGWEDFVFGCLGMLGRARAGATWGWI